MNWQLALILLSLAVMLAVSLGRSRLEKKYRPLSDVVLIIGAFFLGIYAALALTTLVQHQVEREQVVALLSAAKKDAEAYRRYLSDCPSSQSGASAEEMAGYFKSNPRNQPLIIEKLFSKDIVLRNISTVSYYDVTVLTSSIREAQIKMNAGITSSEDGRSLIAINLREIELLSKILSWEMLYQQDRLSVAKLREFSEQLFNE